MSAADIIITIAVAISVIAGIALSIRRSRKGGGCGGSCGGCGSCGNGCERD